MRFTVTFKMPDAFDQVKAEIEDKMRMYLDEGEIDQEQYDRLVVEKIDAAEVTFNTFVQHGECITVEFDTIGTASIRGRVRT